MRTIVKIILFICGVCGILTMALLCYIYFPWIILPTKSTSQELTLVTYAYLSIHQVKMKYYVNEAFISEYVLELKNGIRNRQPQKYRLPKLVDGRVEVIVEFHNGINHENDSAIMINYELANDFYNRGLLVFLATDDASRTYSYLDGLVHYNDYTYFISGNERIYYSRKSGSKEWVIVTEAPELKRVTRIDRGYSPLPYGVWEKNEWVELPAPSD